jgi:hypothetical protein
MGDGLVDTLDDTRSVAVEVAHGAVNLRKCDPDRQCLLSARIGCSLHLVRPSRASARAVRRIVAVSCVYNLRAVRCMCIAVQRVGCYSERGFFAGLGQVAFWVAGCRWLVRKSAVSALPGALFHCDGVACCVVVRFGVQCRLAVSLLRPISVAMREAVCVIRMEGLRWSVGHCLRLLV